MKKINELNLPTQNKELVRPSHESVIEWGNRVDKLWERFLILHKEGYIPNVSDEDIRKHNETF